MKSFVLHREAIRHRMRGDSYNMIKQQLGLAKSTLSNWLQYVPYKANRKVASRIILGHEKTARIRHNQKIASITRAKELAKKEIGKLSKRDLFLLGIGLYWGEGDKRSGEGIKIMNSDPIIINTAIRWFKEICGLNNKNFKLTVYTYPDNNVTRTINYWSKVTGIPRGQFGKTQIDMRTNKSLKNKGKLPFGTIKLAVRSNGHKEFGVFLHRRIMGWIETISQQITAGIV